MKNESVACSCMHNLKQVKADLGGYRWPSAAEGFRQCLLLMAAAWNVLQQDGSTRRVAGQLVKFAQWDARWETRWKKERAKIFA